MTSEQPGEEAADLELLRQWDWDHVWHPFEPHDIGAPQKPPLFVRGEGCWLIDSEGNRVLDGVSSLWCNLHGHRVPEIDQAIRDQLDQLAHSSLLGAINIPAARLARKLVEVAPKGLSRVYFSDDGATAVEAALKIAFQYQQQRPNPQPGKNRFLALNEAYHGDTLGAVAVGDIPPPVWSAAFSGQACLPALLLPLPFEFEAPGMRFGVCERGNRAYKAARPRTGCCDRGTGGARGCGHGGGACRLVGGGGFGL